MCRIQLEPSTPEKRQPILEAESIGNRSDELPTGPERPCHFSHKVIRERHMLEDLPGNNQVEHLICEGDRTPQVRSTRSD
jgi:hypothetical protein